MLVRGKGDLGGIQCLLLAMEINSPSPRKHAEMLTGIGF